MVALLILFCKMEQYISQGMLSPHLFNLYVDDFIISLWQSGHGIYVSDSTNIDAMARLSQTALYVMQTMLFFCHRHVNHLSVAGTLNVIM